MNQAAEIVYVIEDDPHARDSIRALIASMGLRAAVFASAEEFLQQFQESWHGCLVLDMRLPGLSGLDLQQQLTQIHSRLAVVLISGHATVSAAVQAMQNGAVTFIEKPYRNDDLQDAIRTAIDRSRARSQEWRKTEAFKRRLESLTPRERTVLQDVLADKPNRTIARDLAVSIRTAARLRAAVFEKFEVMSATDLAQLVALEGGSDLLPARNYGGFESSCEPA